MLMFTFGVSPTTISPWLQILQGLLTPVIGLTTLYIAWQQWRMSERKSILDRYERRLQIYQRIVEMLRLTVRDSKPELVDLLKFSVDTAEADFLFGEEIPKYINEIYDHGLKLHNSKASVDAHMQEEEWFVSQFSIAKEKFKRYLDIST